MEHRAKKQLETTGKIVRDWFPAFEKAHAMEPPGSPFYADSANCVSLLKPLVLQSFGVQGFYEYFGNRSGEFESFVDSLLTLAAWRPTQGIYRIDPTLFQALINTPVDGCIPVETLFCLPEWCVYIETPGLTFHNKWSGMEESLHGVWVRLEGSPVDDTLQILLMVDFEQKTAERAVLFPPQFSFPFSKDKPIKVMVEELVKRRAVGVIEANGRTEEANLYSHIQTWVLKVLSLLLYLCTAPEYSKKGEIVPPPVKPQPKKVKGGMRLFPAQHPTTWEVGVRLGTALRTAYQANEKADANSSGHSSPRAHIRRGHWHSYRTGPMVTPKGEPIPAKSRNLKTIWQPPIPVNLPDVDKMPAVIRQVRAS